jgi:hypothetical protein
MASRAAGTIQPVIRASRNAETAVIGQSAFVSGLFFYRCCTQKAAVSSARRGNVDDGLQPKEETPRSVHPCPAGDDAGPRAVTLGMELRERGSACT